MLSIGGAGSSIAFLTFEGGFPLRLEREGANVTLHRFVARDGAWKRPVLYAHLYGNRDEEFWSEAEAVRRAKDEIIVALLDVQRAASHDLDLAAYLRTFKERTVLVLGDFKQGRARLDAIRTSLADRGYEPVLLDEVPDDLNYDLPQKFLAVASVCRFLVFDDTTAAGQIAELMLARNLDPIRVVLREADLQSTFMTVGQELTSKVVREWTYDSVSLESVLDEAIEWAEGLVQELREGRISLYPWREDES